MYCGILILLVWCINTQIIHVLRIVFDFVKMFYVYVYAACFMFFVCSIYCMVSTVATQSNWGVLFVLFLFGLFSFLRSSFNLLFILLSCLQSSFFLLSIFSSFVNLFLGLEPTFSVLGTEAVPLRLFGGFWRVEML